MSESIEELQALVEREKASLTEHLAELEQKVRENTDWRVQVARRPLAAVGIALAGGVALGMLGGGRRRSAPARVDAPNTTSEPRPAAEPSPVVAHLQDAAVSIAAGIMVGFLRDFLQHEAPAKTEPATPV